jgi:F0F1-type ATP synthase membrane subunit b/b'
MAKAMKTLGIVILMVVLSGALHAGGGGEHHGFDWVGFLGKLFNATLLFGGLIFFLRKPIIEMLTQKSLDVKNEIHQKEEQVKSTSSQLDEICKRLDKIEEEVSGMKAAAKSSGEQEQIRIEELGKKEAQRIVELTETEIATKIENSVRNLKSRIADLTIDHFKKDIESQLDKKAHEKIIEKNIEISGDIIERE